MKSPRLKKIRIKDPLYQSDIFVLVGGDVAAVRKFLQARHGGDVRLFNKNNDCTDEMGVGETTDGLQFHVNGEKETFYAWISAKDVDTLWHEIYHLVNDILFCRGIFYSDSAEDAFAYFGGALFAQAYRKIF